MYPPGRHLPICVFDSTLLSPPEFPMSLDASRQITQISVWRTWGGAAALYIRAPGNATSHHTACYIQALNPPHIYFVLSSSLSLSFSWLYPASCSLDPGSVPHTSSPPRQARRHRDIQDFSVSRSIPAARLFPQVGRYGEEGNNSPQAPIVDITSLLQDSDSNESPVSPTQQPPFSTVPASATSTVSTSGPPPAVFAVTASPLSPRFGTAGGTRARAPSISGPTLSSRRASRPRSGGGKRSMPPHTLESPAKKQTKWSSQEDTLIIELRGSGMKWDDISKKLPGRSAISCRLHYQNYLERRSEWDEERKNKLARLYERFKSEMWAKVAEEMQLPWRAVEAMHWQIAELTTGVSPYNTPAYAQGGGPQPPPTPSHPYYTHNPHPPAYPPYQHQPSTTTSPIHSSATDSPGPGGGGLLPALSPYPQQYEAAQGSSKRRASPPDHRLGSRETTRRRQDIYSSSSAAARDGPARDDYPPPPPPGPQQQPSVAVGGVGMGPGAGPGLPAFGMGAAMPARRGSTRHGL
ncbi:hypothetical protein F5144DRAFT_595132 [Chaetomium tenue]|uniref:Uncharacterized protein n=1 Tax=Chaetomium tenue TaxID=1854479 RepID=A0ACB7NZZ6_9PEZI|nr:hypothetical protein F5144DRAFT_595132 [Chaetomium globosum]